MKTIEFNLEEFINGRVAYTEFGYEVQFLTLLNNTNKFRRVAVKIICINNQEILDTCSDSGFLFENRNQLVFKKNSIKLKTVYFKDKELPILDQIVSVNFELNDLGMKRYEKFMEDIIIKRTLRTVLYTTEVEIPLE